MVSSVLVELVGDAGEAPSGTKSGNEGVNRVPGGHGTAGVREEDIFGMEIECHVIVPSCLLGTHSVEI